MRRLKKKLVALGLALATMASSVMSMSASADVGFLRWPAYFVPYTGNFYADSEKVEVRNIRWTADQLEQYKIVPGTENYQYSIEFEFRPTTHSTAYLWHGKGTLDSDLPLSYGEYDENDVTIVCANMALCVPEQAYNLILPMVENPEFDTWTTPPQFAYLFEVELGYYMIGDSWPQLASRYNNDTNVGTARWGTRYYW